jgi:hypothetical protein
METRYLWRSFCAALALGLACLGTPALAHDQNCTSTLTSNVNGNVFVPNGETCTLQDLTVTGNVRVGGGSTLNATGAVILGNLEAHNPAAITLQCDSGTPPKCSSVGGNFHSNGGSPGDLFFDSAKIGHNLQVEKANSIVAAGGSVVGDNVQIHGTRGVPPAILDKSQSSICNTGIGGNLQLDGNHAPFVIGTVGPGECGSPGSVSVGGNVQVHNNAVSGSSPSVRIDNTDIEHNLQCRNNQPPQTGANNDVDGNVQCEGVATAETDSNE